MLPGALVQEYLGTGSAVAGTRSAGTGIAASAPLLTLSTLRAKGVPLSATGSRDVNQLVKALNCHCEAANACRDLVARYEACHSAVVGGGAMDGRLHCALELKELLACVSKP